MNVETEKAVIEPSGEPIKLIDGNPVVVNSSFILVVHFGRKDQDKQDWAKLGIFAPGRMEIQRGNVVNNRKNIFKKMPADEITHLILGFNEQEETVKIGDFQIKLLSRGNNFFNIKITSPEQLEIETLTENVYHRERAQELLSRYQVSRDQHSATKEDIKKRRKFEIERSLQKVRLSKAHPVEISILRKQEIISL